MSKIKKVLLGLLSVIGNVILAIVAYYLFKYLFYPALLVLIVRAAFKNRLLSSLSNFFFKIGFGIDQTGNAAFAEILNATLKKEGVGASDQASFGNPDETISSVLGRLQLAGHLSITGWFVVMFLWLVDFQYWFKGGHCVNSIGS